MSTMILEASNKTFNSAERRLRTRIGLDLTVRPATLADEATLIEFFEHVSPEDLRFRFLTSVQKLSPAQAHAMVAVDHCSTENFLAFDGGGTLVATAMLAANSAFDQAEVAIAVRADHKHEGVGWTMLEFVSEQARLHGIRRLIAIESCDNHEAIGLEREMGFSAAPCPGDSTLVLLSKDLEAQMRAG